ncbi:MAG: hypothetical protein M1816_000220 [Peltula sp. TS41687]|nr:MAG: hypothetical protein M1816_000220 [Peltula sp. TS41687]
MSSAGIIKVGRGGAGNYHDAQELDREASMRNAEDIESQQSPGLEFAEQKTVNRPAPEYAYSGRGGSGNIYSPKELEEQGTFQSGSAVTTTTTTKTATADRGNAGAVGGFGGRGGAGNIRQQHVVVDADRERSSREVEARLKEKVTQEVEAVLPPPPQVHLAPE